MYAAHVGRLRELCELRQGTLLTRLKKSSVLELNLMVIPVEISSLTSSNLQLCLERHANVNSVSNTARTALSYSITYAKDTEIFHLLMNEGYADPLIKLNDTSLLELAKRTGDSEKIKTVQETLNGFEKKVRIFLLLFCSGYCVTVDDELGLFHNHG